jgi:hypothetical protein
MTERDKIVEIAARAIYSEEPVGVREWQDAPVATADSCRAMATAALAALEKEGYEVVEKPLVEFTPEQMRQILRVVAENIGKDLTPNPALAASSPKE